MLQNLWVNRLSGGAQPCVTPDPDNLHNAAELPFGCTSVTLWADEPLRSLLEKQRSRDSLLALGGATLVANCRASCAPIPGHEALF